MSPRAPELVRPQERKPLRPLRGLSDGAPELGGYRAAAAVLASFLPDRLQPVDEDSSAERRERVLADEVSRRR